MPKRDGCTGKMRHAKRRFALKHIASLKEPGMNAYKCRQCGFWHIGHADRIAGIQSRLDRLIGPDPRTANRELRTANREPRTENRELRTETP